MSRRTIVVSNTSKLDYQLGFMVVRGEETVRVHINEIEMLIIESTAVSLTAYLLNELIKNKVKVVFCDEKRNPSSELLPYYEMITSNIELDLLRLFKMYDVRLEPQCDSILETLIEYTKVLSRLLRKKLLILINISNYLDGDSVKELARMCAYQKLNLLFIEHREINFRFPVKTYIIDSDRCLIIK